MCRIAFASQSTNVYVTCSTFHPLPLPAGTNPILVEYDIFTLFKYAIYVARGHIELRLGLGVGSVVCLMSVTAQTHLKRNAEILGSQHSTKCLGAAANSQTEYFPKTFRVSLNFRVLSTCREPVRSSQNNICCTKQSRHVVSTLHY